MPLTRKRNNGKRLRKNEIFGKKKPILPDNLRQKEFTLKSPSRSK